MIVDGAGEPQLGVRELAERGILADHCQRASADARRQLRIEAYALLYPVVFGQLTRRVEARRGHRDCMASVSRLRPECLDSFHDDMDAVLCDLFRNARLPVRNLEGWVTRRLAKATIDGYRRRRGARGALQRPRLPRWLAQALHDDDGLMALAIQVLAWVGQETTAGGRDWPIEAWAQPRIPALGDYGSACRSVERDLAVVIAAMRTRPGWYADYVERPMGHKRFPLATSHQDGLDRPANPTAPGALDTTEARRRELAALALEIIRVRVERGDDPRTTVREVIATVFGAGTGSESIDQLPGAGWLDDEQVILCLADGETIDRIVAEVLAVLGQ